MSEWKEYRLGDICEIFAGGDAPKEKYSKLKTNEYNIPIFSNGITDEGLYGYTDKARVLTPATTITARGTVGVVFRRKEPYFPIVRLISVIGNKELLDSDFLYYKLKSTYIDGEGSVQAQLTVPMISNYRIDIPSLEKQRSIASILSSLDDKIAVNRRICENLEAQAQALFKHWFIDFAPFKNGQFVESELGMIPEGWRVGSPYEYVDFIYGAPYKSNLFNDKKEGLPLIRIRDLKDCSPQFYTPEILPKTEYVKAGDVLAGMDAEFAPYIWKGQKGLLNQRVCKIKPKNTSIGRLFCMLLVKPQLLFVQAVKTGTTVSHIGKSDIDRFKVVLPPFEDVVKFSTIGEEILEAIITLSAENQRLSTLRDSLLPKLMFGQIKV